ncbi:MAG: beta-propeller fold lactonase family protein [Vulcanimicrobiota bacterium]
MGVSKAASLVLATLMVLFLGGCNEDGSVNESRISEGQVVLTPLESAAILQRSLLLTRAVNGLFMLNSFVVNDPQPQPQRSSVDPFDEDIRIPGTNFITEQHLLTTTEAQDKDLPEGTIRIRVREVGKAYDSNHVLYCLPAVFANNQFTQEIRLGSNTESFFGCFGRATEVFDAGFNLLSLGFTQLIPFSERTTVFGGQGLFTLQSNGRFIGDLTVPHKLYPGALQSISGEALQTNRSMGFANADTQGLFNFLGVQGQVTLNNLGGGGQIATPTNGTQAGTVTPGGILQVALPDNSQLADGNIDDGGELSDNLPVPANGSLTLTFDNNAIEVGQTAFVFVNAFDGNGNLVPFTTRSGRLTSDGTHVRVVTSHSVVGQSLGVDTLTYRDDDTGKEATGMVTVFQGTTPPTPPAPGPVGGYLYVSDSGNDQIDVFPFNITTGALGNSSQVASTGANPSDLLVLRNEQLLLVAVDGGLDVYSISQQNGQLSLLRSNTLGFTPADLSESGKMVTAGANIRLFATKSGSPLSVLELNPTNGQVQQLAEIPFAGFPFDLTNLAVGSDEFLFVTNNSNGVVVFQVPDAFGGAVPNQQFDFPVASQLSEVAVSFASGPVLEILDLNGSALLSASINTANGLSSILDIANSTRIDTVGRPRGLAVDDLSDVAYFGSEFVSNSLDGFGLTGPPTAPVHLTNAPYAASGNAIAVKITGSSAQLIYALTSPQNTLELFLQNANLSLMSNSQVTLPGANAQAQDLEAVILND